MSPRSGDRRHNLHLLHLIVDDLSLWSFYTILALKLPPQEGVSDGNGCHTSKIIVRGMMDTDSEFEHTTVSELGRVLLLGEGSVFRYLNVSIK